MTTRKPDPPHRPSAPVPQGRARRFMHFGRAVGELAAGAAAEGFSRLARGERLELSNVMLTPSNARRLTERLSQMRGAVMKVGQLMSMDGRGVLPPEFADLMAKLRDRAHTMPATQLAEVLEQEWGAGWHQRFRRFSFEPVAAASIGQVHRAETRDGRVLALKIQYPGVRRSIDSDIANLALLGRTPGLVPPAVDFAAVLERVRQQLHHETDYRAEARATTEYRRRLGDDPVFTVPQVHDDFSSDRILATDFASGLPIDRLTEPGHPQAQRQHAAHALSRLAVHEFFRMRLVQTDPNFANYLFDPASGRITLLDFGATEEVTPMRVEHLRELGRALRDKDEPRLVAASLAAGFIDASDPPAQARGMVQMMLTAGEPLQQRGPYDFGASNLFARTFEQGRAQFFGDGFARTPPPDLMFFQRKFVGSFMLCSRLDARLDLLELFGDEL